MPYSGSSCLRYLGMYLNEDEDATGRRPAANPHAREDRSTWGESEIKKDPCQGLVVGKPDTGRAGQEFSVGGSFLDLYIPAPRILEDRSP